MADSELTITILVEEGDTLGSLAESYYQDVNQWETILQANPTLQEKGQNDALSTGTQVTLPGQGGVRHAFVYRTGTKDTLRRLAHKFYHDDNKWSIILNANPMLGPIGPDDRLPAGLGINIP